MKKAKNNDLDEFKYLVPHTSRLFNGNVIEPLPIVIIVCLVGVALIGVTVDCIWTCFYPNYTPQELITDQYHIHDISEDDEYITLDTDKGTIQINKLLQKAGYITVDDLEQVKSNDRTITAKTDKMTVMGQEIYRLWSLSIDGVLIMSEHDTLAVYNKDTVKAAFVFSALTVLYWVLSIVSYRILCHPERHPVIAKLLIKEGNRNF